MYSRYSNSETVSLMASAENFPSEIRLVLLKMENFIDEICPYILVIVLKILAGKPTAIFNLYA